MTAAFATILFLTALFVVAAMVAVVVEESAATIRAALAGGSRLAHHRNVAVPVRISSRARVQRPVRAEARWRAAA